MMQIATKQLIANLLPEDVIDFEERAAISEFLGGLSREEAEKLALNEVMARRMRGKSDERPSHLPIPQWQ